MLSQNIFNVNYVFALNMFCICKGLTKLLIANRRVNDKTKFIIKSKNRQWWQTQEKHGRCSGFLKNNLPSNFRISTSLPVQ